ncbi:hypothetical protein [Anaplasma phagocytophilum]|uniref:Type IV secretion system VirB6 family domain protein n=1 Tax=Anaplasma phagocytophilum str. NCH-1 TaxID=1359161 RepID=A0A0F3NDS4_ANAPH|nr:hypothetical protein [Anaplasma phagocytophilum]KJV66223.1 type IV secretion system VirB6 family domain protein [Anaplasma phagocytophilum str. NCH-1]
MMLNVMIRRRMVYCDGTSRKVVPEATEYGTKPDDQDGDKGDLRPERLDPDIGGW